jgi:hypothetical protein
MGRAEDRKMLRTLLRNDDCLEPDELEAFTSMWDRLDSGRIDSLSSRQREWVERVYYKHDLDKEEEAENLVSSGKVKVTDKERASLQQFLDSLGPRPLKPPGRR